MTDAAPQAAQPVHSPASAEAVRRAPRVVLVRPEFAGNLGSAARAMANFAASELVLVAPRASPDDREARALSTRGEPILDSARIVPDLASALADCVAVVGTTANLSGPYRTQAAGRPREVFAELVRLSTAGPVALVFGPEDHGLSNSELALCHRLVRLPTAAVYPVLNLSQAVMLSLYEWHQAQTDATGHGATPQREERPLASSAHLQRLFDRLEDALTRVGFLLPDNPKHLMYALRNLLYRARLTPTEADILLGLARQIRWYTDTHPRRAPPPEPRDAQP